MFRMIQVIADRLSDLGAVAVMGSAALIFIDVFSRLVFNAPFPGTAEIVGLAVVVVTFLQIPKVVATGRLLRVAILLQHLPEPVGRVLTAASYALGAVVFGALAVMSWSPVVEAYATQEFFGTDAFRVTAWPIRAGVLVLWLAAAFVFAACALQPGKARDVAEGDEA